MQVSRKRLQVSRKSLPSVLLCTRTGPICTHLPRAQNPSQSTDTPTPQAFTGEHARKPAGEGYILRTTYPYYISSAESPRERAIYYALHIRIIYQALKAQPRELSVPHALHTRIMYQAPKARPRELWNTHYVSVLYIKRRTITRGEHNIHDPRSTRDRPETDPRPTRDRPEIDPRLT